MTSQKLALVRGRPCSTHARWDPVNQRLRNDFAYDIYMLKRRQRYIEGCLFTHRGHRGHIENMETSQRSQVSHVTDKHRKKREPKQTVRIRLPFIDTKSSWK